MAVGVVCDNGDIGGGMTWAGVELGSVCRESGVDWWTDWAGDEPGVALIVIPRNTPVSSTAKIKTATIGASQLNALPNMGIAGRECCSAFWFAAAVRKAERPGLKP